MIATAGDDRGLRSFWIGFHLVFTCFFLNLFIGVLSASFEKSNGSATMTLGEKQWVASKLAVSLFSPTNTDQETLRPVTTSTCFKRQQPLWWFKVRHFMFEAACNERLDMFWRAVILVNTLLLATGE